MSNLLQDAAAWLGERLKDAAGRQGVYTRQTTQTGTITGTPAEMRQEVVGEGGFGTGVFVYGWLFTAADLVIGGTRIEPVSANFSATRAAWFFSMPKIRSAQPTWPAVSLIRAPFSGWLVASALPEELLTLQRADEYVVQIPIRVDNKPIESISLLTSATLRSGTAGRSSARTK